MSLHDSIFYLWRFRGTATITSNQQLVNCSCNKIKTQEHGAVAFITERSSNLALYFYSHIRSQSQGVSPVLKVWIQISF